MTDDRGTAGFTLLEALVALAVTGVVLASLSSLVAASIHGTWSTEARLRSRQIARSVLASLPERGKLNSHYHGSVDGARWELQVRPYPTPDQSNAWAAAELVVTVQPPRGSAFILRTVRLVPRERT